MGPYKIGVSNIGNPARESCDQMPGDLNFKLRHVSVVFLLSQPVDPQSINTATLVQNQIVPGDWQVINEVNLAGVLAQTQYRNGANIRAEGNRCVFQQDVGGEFREQYDAHEVALNYAEASRVVTYRAVGFNWLIEPDVEYPERWLTGKFAEDSAFVPGFQPVSVKISRPQGAALCNLTFNLEQGGVQIDCNYHVDLAGKRAIDVIRMWPHYQKNLFEDILPNISR